MPQHWECDHMDFQKHFKENSTWGIPFNDAIRSETHVLDRTSKATASSCAPCLSSIVGT